mmetsp:Transcript_59326/g.143204  ORF Transcript_59326/g.143204 Transcript_59326/m.143204 type:complete len:272 (-) Transcript_59326:471-1286(-)
MSTKKRFVLSLQHSLASQTLWFSHGRSSLGDHVPKPPSSWNLCMDEEKKPAAMIVRIIADTRRNHSTRSFFVPWKKRQPQSRASTRAVMMGRGRELRSSTSETTPTRKMMDSRPSRRPVVNARIRKECFLPKLALASTSPSLAAATVRSTHSRIFRSWPSLAWIILKKLSARKDSTSDVMIIMTPSKTRRLSPLKSPLNNEASARKPTPMHMQSKKPTLAPMYTSRLKRVKFSLVIIPSSLALCRNWMMITRTITTSRLSRKSTTKAGTEK